MRFEIDMLDVGNADAIIIHYFDENEEEFVVLIDVGKTAAHGQQIEDHIKTYTLKKSIDLAINTHPDSDHIGGFFYLLSTDIKINEFWIHDPSQHKIRQGMPDKINPSGLITALENQCVQNSGNIEKSLSYLCESLKASDSILTIIDRKEITRLEPFDGQRHPKIPIQVLGPSEAYYDAKLDWFRDVEVLYEEQKNLLLEKAQESGPLTGQGNLLTDRDFLDKDNERSHENNSSVVLCFKPKDDIYLFTADAGPEALNNVKSRHELSNIYFLQVPHHGSRYNITSELLDYFNPSVAYISCEQTEKYPCKQLVNILKENKCTVCPTGIFRGLRLSENFGKREGFNVCAGV